MSLLNPNTTIPDTLRTFESNKSIYKLTGSLFITPYEFSFTTDQFEDDDYYYDQLGINIFPLHGVNEFTPEDLPTEYAESLQGYAYPVNKGKYRHKATFDYSLEYHQLVNDLSGQKVRVIYIDTHNKVIRGTKQGDEVKGFKIDTIHLEKLLWHVNNSNGDSNLYLELFDSDELNIYGYEVCVDWEPERIDRLVLNISISYGEDSMVLGVRYLGENIAGIDSSEITITDEVNGQVNFGLFIPGDGVYTLGNFDKIITRGYIYIQSRIYIGCKRYIYSFTVKTPINFEFINGSNFEFISGANFELINKQ